MDAAVADMTPDAQGLLQPDPTPADPNAYPLTYVEYALVPAQPLVDATCAPRTASQAQLVTWLKYVTGDGQKVLPDGLQPLTPALQTAAATAIAQVGATPNTCTPPPGTASADGSGSGSGSSSGTGSSAGGSASGSGSGSGSSGAANSVTSSAPGGLAGPKTIAARVAVPPYGGSKAADAVATVAALVGIVALVTLAARYTAGLGGSSSDELDLAEDALAAGEVDDGDPP